jgi:hypothetical protein
MRGIDTPLIRSKSSSINEGKHSVKNGTGSKLASFLTGMLDVA